MKAIDFKQSTKVLQSPSNMPNCENLPVWSDGKQCVSCWKASFKERLLILLTGKVWLGVHSGGTQPPVFLAGEDVFVYAPIKAQIRAYLAWAKESITQVWESVKNAIKTTPK